MLDSIAQLVPILDSILFVLTEKNCEFLIAGVCLSAGALATALVSRQAHARVAK